MTPLEAVEEKMVTFKAKYLVHVVYVLLMGGAAMAGFIGHGAYNAGGQSAAAADAVRSINKTVQQQSSDLNSFKEEENEQLEQLRIEVEWLIRHNPDAKDAPMDYMHGGHSAMTFPHLAQYQAPQNADIPLSVSNNLTPQ